MFQFSSLLTQRKAVTLGAGSLGVTEIKLMLGSYGESGFCLRITRLPTTYLHACCLSDAASLLLVQKVI